MGGGGGWGMGQKPGHRLKGGVGRGLISGSLQYWDSFQQLIKMIVIHRMIIFLDNK